MKMSFLFSRELSSACGGVMPQRARMKSEGFISKEPLFLSLL